MPTLLIVQVAGGKSFDSRFKKSAAEDIKLSNAPTPATSAVLDTMIVTRTSAGNVEIQEVSLEVESPRGTSASV